MGGNTSQPPPLPTNFPYFSLTFRIHDKIKLIDCDDQCLTLIQQVVAANWPRGIQSQRYDRGAFEIKFRGFPFSESGDKAEPLVSKRMCCALLLSLQTAGWELYVNSHLSQTTDLTTWFFQRNPALIGKQLPAEGGIICLGLSSSDKLQLINAPAFLHNELLQCVGTLLQTHEVHGSDFEVKMVGRPWSDSSFEEGVSARQLLLNIIRKLDSHNFRFYGTAKFKGTADCIFFEQDRNYVGGKTGFCMLSLNGEDRIRLIDCPQSVVETVGRYISQYWPDGIQDTRQHEHCVEYKLKGYPGRSDGDDAINSRFLITNILQSLVPVGWMVMGALVISYTPFDKAVFVLRSCAPTSIPHMCISPSRADLIQLINAPKDVHEAVASVIHSNWPHGVQREGTLLMAYEWKLSGKPWSSKSGNDYAMSRHLMTRLLNEMTRMGWHVICSADVSTDFIGRMSALIQDPIDVHSWYLARTGHVAQQPNMPCPSSAAGFGMAFASPPGTVPPPSYNEAMSEK
uniref:Uncharacterized protein n=1 Tax=Plectus sambesii TaxID=2011161 RepID=A0A914VRX9_9BILA